MSERNGQRFVNAKGDWIEVVTDEGFYTTYNTSHACQSPGGMKTAWGTFDAMIRECGYKPVNPAPAPLADNPTPLSGEGARKGKGQ